MIRDTAFSKLFQAMALILLLTDANTTTAETIGGIAGCPYAPLPEVVPTWGEPDIMASRMVDNSLATIDAPPWALMNITLFLETDGFISVLNKDSFEVLDQFQIPIGVYGNPKIGPDGRYAFVLSCDGWVQKYDIWSGQQVGRVRAGLNARNIAVSADGKWLAVANALPNALTILSASDLSVGAVHEISGADGTPSRVSGVLVNPLRESFVLALTDLPKIWEAFYGPNPPAIGFSHDWRIEGTIPQSTPFPIRKFTIPAPLVDFTLDHSYEYALGTTDQGGGVVIDLVIGQKVADLNLPNLPHLGSGVMWNRGGATVLATTHLQDNVVSVINMNTWETVERITTDGPAIFLCCHEASNYLWVNVISGPNTGALQIIDKQTLEVVRTMPPD